jgi:hypothetical protein
MLPAFFSTNHVEVSAMTERVVLFEEQVEFPSVN